MKRLAIALLLILGLNAIATDIRYGYTAITKSATNLDVLVSFDQPAMMVDLKNISTNDVQFAINCPDANVWTNLYTNSICGVVSSNETKKIQISNYPIKSIRLRSIAGSNNTVYVTGI